MAKAYAELEAKLGKPAEVTEELPEEIDPEDVEEAEEGDKDETKDDDAPVTPGEAFEALNARFMENGTFDDDDYAFAEKVGYSREMVDSYLAGQQALAEATTRQLHEAAGGTDNMERMFVWAKASLTAAEIDRFNAHFQGNDVNSAIIAMEQLRGRYEKANPNQKLVSGRSSGGSVDAFESWAQVTVAMSDPRYRSDAAYNRSVADKLARSNLK